MNLASKCSVLVLLVLNLLGCSRQEVGALRFETISVEFPQKESSSIDREHHVGAYYWSGVFKSAAFVTFADTQLSLEDKALVQRVSLRPKSRSIAGVSLRSGTPAEEKIAALVVARALNAFHLSQQIAGLKAAEAKIRNATSLSASEKSNQEEKLRELGITISQIQHSRVATVIEAEK